MGMIVHLCLYILIYGCSLVEFQVNLFKFSFRRAVMKAGNISLQQLPEINFSQGLALRQDWPGYPVLAGYPEFLTTDLIFVQIYPRNLKIF